MNTIDLSLDYVTVQAGDRTLKFYPLNFKALRLLGKEFATLRDGQSTNMVDRLGAVASVLLASANRNGPQITEEEMDEMFDPVWANKVLDAVNKLSGFRPVPALAPADAAAGDAAVRPTKPPNGEASTQA